MIHRGELTKELLVLVGFLLTSAHGLMEEPKIYGPARLLDAASRLLALMDEQGLLDAPTQGIRAEVDRQVFETWDEEALLNGLNELSLRWTESIACKL